MRLQAVSEFKVYKYSTNQRKFLRYNVKAGDFRYSFVECYNRIFGTEFEPHHLLERNRKGKVVDFRYWYWYIIHKERDEKKLHLAKSFGYNHATVAYGLGKVESDLNMYQKFKNRYIRLKFCLKNKNIL